MGGEDKSQNMINIQTVLITLSHCSRNLGTSWESMENKVGTAESNSRFSPGFPIDFYTSCLVTNQLVMANSGIVYDHIYQGDGKKQSDVTRVFMDLWKT